MSLTNPISGLDECCRIFAGDLVVEATFDPRDGFPRPIQERIRSHGDGWLPTGMYEASIERARKLVDGAGRDASSFDVAYYQGVVIAETKAAAIDDARVSRTVLSVLGSPERRPHPQPRRVRTTCGR